MPTRVYVLAFRKLGAICKYIRLQSSLFTSTYLGAWKQLFESKLMAEKISCFEIKNFRALKYPYNLFEYFQNKDIDSNNTL